MSRRSSRLVSGGYYNSDEESDSSSVTNISISYRENPVKVFKKKAGARKPGSRTSSRANSNASSAAPDTPVTPVPSPLSIKTQPIMRTVPFTPSVATPRPALSPSSSTLSQTPTGCHSASPGKSSPGGCHSASPAKSSPSGHCSAIRPRLHFRTSHKELSQSGVDSSGYSSSEGTYRKPMAAPCSTARVSSGDPNTGYRSRIKSAFNRLSDSALVLGATVYSKTLDVAALANSLISSRTAKACGVALLLLLVLLLGLWLFLPLLTSFISHINVTKSPSQRPPVVPATPPPRQHNNVYPTPVVDPTIVSAAVDEKMQRLLVELQMKQDLLLSQMKESLQLEMRDMKVKLEATGSDGQQHLEQEVAGLSRQMADYQSDSRTAAASLILRIKALEDQNNKLAQELSSIQVIPPPAPCPNPTQTPIHNHLTPELQQAIEKWLTNRIKEQDAIRLSSTGSCTGSGRPMADKVADFALETQGASVISTRCSETYRIRSACVTLFGFPLWYPSESPRTVIQGYPVLLPGKCWAFHGVQGTLVISLSHPIWITHVTLDHLPRYNSPTGRIDSAPKDFEIYGMTNDAEEGTLLGTFTYDEYGDPTQTFKIPKPSDKVYRVVELRVLSNWGHVEYTCLYRFRVHGQIATT